MARSKRASLDLRDLRIAPWIDAIEAREVQEAVIHYIVSRQSRDCGDVPAAKLAEIDRDAEEALRAVRSGKLRGTRASKRIVALDDRLLRAIEASRVDCPTCGTRVSPKRLRGLRRIDPAEVRRALARPIPETIRGPSPRVVLDEPTRAHIAEIERVALRALRAREREEQRLRKLLGVGPSVDLGIAQAKTRCVCGCSFTAHAAEKPHPCRGVTRGHVKMVGDEGRTLEGERCKCRRFRRERGPTPAEIRRAERALPPSYVEDKPRKAPRARKR